MIGGSVESVPVLAVIGVSESNHKLVLALQSGDKESASCRREIFRDLKNRGLDADKIRLGVMDGLRGLETVFKEEFHKAKVQRCQVHVSRNMTAKVPRKNKQEVAVDANHSARVGYKQTVPVGRHPVSPLFQNYASCSFPLQTFGVYIFDDVVFFVFLYVSRLFPLRRTPRALSP